MPSNLPLKQLRQQNRHPLARVAALCIALGLSLPAIAQTCALHPIAMAGSSLSNAVAGVTTLDIYNGTGAGQFGWLSWGGSPSEPTLVASLAPAGDSFNYVNPDNVADRQVSVGDWIASKPGVSNSKKVAAALDALTNLDLAIPVWDQTRGAGDKVAYRVSGFAMIRILNYQLPQQNRITARFLGFTTCNQQNLAPSVSAGSDQTITLPASASLTGTVSDDHLPTGSTLTVSWSFVSGPGTVIFAATNSVNTIATFSAPGIYVVRLTASDSQLTGSDDAVITVNQENLPPVANSQSVTNSEDTSINITLTGNDPDGDALTFVIMSPPPYGSLSGLPPNVTYLPKPDYYGPDAFSFRVNDGSLDSGIATVTITNSPINDVPVADGQTLTTDEDAPLNIALSGSDVEGGLLSYTILSYPTNGTVSGTAPNVIYQPAANFHGTDGFTIRVSDRQLSSLPALVSITVVSINDQPVVNAGLDQLISLPTNSVGLTGVVDDDYFFETNSLITEWTVITGPGLVAFGDATALSTSAVFGTNGIYVLRLTVSDTLLEDYDDLVVTVNARPVADAGTNQTITYPDIAALNGFVSDDGFPTNSMLTLSWTKVSGSGTVHFSDVHRTNTSASFSEGGAYVLRLTVTDSEVEESDEITITVNKSPTADAGPDQTVTNHVVQLSGSVADDGIGQLTANWNKVSGPGTVTFSTNALESMATFSQSGVYVLELTVNDTFVQVSDQVVIIVNDAPTVNAGVDQTVNFPGSVSIAGSVSDDGLPDATGLSFEWTKVTGPGTVTFADAGATNTAANFSEPGVYVLRLTASDSVLTGSDDVVITANQPPQVDAGHDQTINTLLTLLQGTVSDDGLPANNLLSISWSKVAGPGETTFSANTAATTVSFSLPGNYVLRLTATDGFTYTSDEIAIRVNSVPIAQAQSINVDEDTEVEIVLQAVDSNGDSLTFNILTAPSHGTLGGSAPILTYLPTTNYHGPDSFVFVANDGTVSSLPATLSLVVNPVNDPPIANPQSATTEEDKPVTVTLTGSDVDGDTLTYLVTIQPEHGSLSGVAPNLVYFPATNYSGNDSFTFKTADGFTSSVAIVSITINAVNQAPVVYGGTNQLVVMPSQVSLRGIVTDDNLPTGASLEHLWSKVIGPGTVTFADSTATNTSASFSEAGTYVLRLSSSDTELSGYADVIITVSSLDMNQPPLVDAGTSRVIELTNIITLNGHVSDDGLPPNAPIMTEWHQLAGPGTATFGDSNALVTTVGFDSPGIYVLQLSANDSLESNSDTVEVRVGISCLAETPSDLVAWWSGNYTATEIVSKNNAIMGGNTEFATGYVGPAFKFNGGTAYVQAPASTNLNIGPGAAGFTVEFWMKPSSLQNDSVLGWSNGMRLERYTQSAAGTGLRFYVTGTAGGQYVQSSGNVWSGSPTNWAHVAVTYERSLGQARMYTNGVLAATVNVGTNLLSTAGDFFLGKVPGSTLAPYFGGQLDEVSLYQRPLNPEEVYRVYASGSAGKCPNDGNTAPVVYAGLDLFVTGVPGLATLEGEVMDDGLPTNSSVRVHWSKFDGPGTVSFGNSNALITTATFSTNGIYVLQLTGDDGEVQSRDLVEVRVETLCMVQDPQGLAAWWPGNGSTEDVLSGFTGESGSGANYASGKVAAAFNFDGLNDYVWLPAQSTYNVGPGATGFTVEFWMKPSSLQNDSVLGWSNGMRLERYTQSAAGTGLRFYVAGTASSQYVQSSGNVWSGSPTNWAHVAVTYERSLGQAKMYTNGVLAATANVGTTPLSSTGDFYLGKVPGSTLAPYFGGQLDEISLYQRPLNPEEVYRVYASGSAGKCPNDGNTAPVVYAGPDSFVTGVPGLATLEGEVMDDGLPTNSSVRVYWSKFDGPGTVSFGNSNSLITTATFSTNGIYVLRLTADDGEVQSRDLVEVRVETLCTVQDRQGLAAWWPGNGSTEDVLSGFTGWLGSGANYASGKVAAAFNFDGLNDYVWLPAQSTYNVGPGATGFTVEFWMKPATNLTSSVLGWTNGIRFERYTTSFGGDSLRCLLAGSGTTSVQAPRIWGNSGWSWTHVAMVYDRSLGQARMYTNGILATPTPASVGTNLLTTAGDFYLGQVPGSAGYYNGQLDEVSLYQRPLNPEEVYQVYASGSAGKCPNDGNTAPVVYAGTDFSLGLTNPVANLNGIVGDDGLPIGSEIRIHWEKFEGPGAVTFGNSNSLITTATFSSNGVYVLQLTAEDGEAEGRDLVEVRVGVPCSIQDVSGWMAWWQGNGTAKETLNGFDGLLGSGANYASGKVAAAFNFDGLNDYVWLPAQSTYNVGPGATGFTVEFWMKPATNLTSSVLGWTNGIRFERYTTSFGGDSLRCLLAGSGTTSVQAPRIWGNSGWSWTHVAMVYDRSLGQARMYTNGILATPTPASVGTNLLTTAGDFYLGQVPGSAGYYNGQLDEVSLYNRVLTPTEVQAIYNAGANGKCKSQQNQPPVISVKPTQVASLNEPFNPHATVFDDGLPSNTLTASWRVLSGPSAPVFSDSNSALTAVLFDSTGFYQLELAVTDGAFTSVSNIDVLINSHPSVSLMMTPSTNRVSWQQPLTFRGTASDQESSVVLVDLYEDGTLVASSHTQRDESGWSNFEFNWIVPHVGSLTYSVVATDEQGSATTSQPIHLFCGHQPVIKWLAPLSGSTRMAGWPMELSVLASDLDGTVTNVSYFIAQGVESTFLGSGTGPQFKFVWTPPASGDVVLVARATDNSGLVSTNATNLLHVIPFINFQVSMVSPAPNAVLNLNQPSVLEALAATEGDVPISKVEFYVNGMVIGSDTNVPYQLNWTPNQPGNYSIMAVAQANVMGATAASTPVQISVNVPPLLNAGADRTNTVASLPTAIALKGSVFDDGIPSNTVAVLWERVTGPGAVAFSSSNSKQTLATVNASGAHVFRLTASDGMSSASDEVTIIINQAPVVSAGSDRVVSYLPVELNGTATDDGLPAGGLVINWSSLSGPGAVTFGDSHAAHTTASFSAPGTYQLRLSADDGAAMSSATATVTVLVGSNTPPVAYSQTITLNTNTSRAIVLKGTDADYDPLTFVIDSMPTNGVLSGTPPLVTYRSSATSVEPDSFTFSANDGQTNSIPAVVGITVIPGPNHPPVAEEGDLWTRKNSAVRVYLEATDEDEDPLTYRIVGQPQHGRLQGDLPSSLIYVPERDYVGDDSFTYTANDGMVESEPATITIDVRFVNEKPYLKIVSPQTDAEFISGDPIPIQVEVFDELPDIVLATIYADDVELTSLFEEPFDFTWESAPIGTHVLTAVSFDSFGRSFSARPVTFSVVPDVTAPQVNAGPDQLVVLPGSATLKGQLKIPRSQTVATTNAAWSVLSGPGSAVFTSPHELVTQAEFNTPGVYVLQLSVVTELGALSDTVQVEALPPAPEHLKTVRSARGKDFWLTFLNNVYDSASLDLIVTSEHDATGEVEFFDPDYATRRTVVFETIAGQTNTVQLRFRADPALRNSDTILRNAIHVTTSSEVSLYGINFMDSSADGFMVFPTAMLGTNYLVMAYANTYSGLGSWARGSQFAVVATESNTTVRIIPSVTTEGHAAGVPFEITLQQGETYRLINNETALGDMTGTAVTSDRPIALLAGNTGTYVPNNVLYADHLAEQLPPVNTWGRHFLTVPLALRKGGDTFRILAAETNTAVSINGKVIAALNRGEFLERVIEDGASIVGNKPLLVAQFANGTEFDQTLGDPFITLVPATDQFGGTYVLSTPLTYIDFLKTYSDVYWFGNFANLIIPAGQAGNLQLDGVPLSPDLQFESIGDSGFEGTQVPISAGVHTFKGASPFGLLMYGWGSYISYAFAGGVYSDTLEADTQLTLKQPVNFAAIGAEKTVIATTTTSRNNPVSDLTITFQVSGANPVPETQIITGRFGEAVFAYRGTNEGMDVITATLLGEHRVITNTWLALSTNQPPIAAAGSDQVSRFGQIVELHGNVSDDGQPGGPLNTSWYTISGPSAAVFANSNAPTTTVQFELPGTYTLELRANDSQFAVRDSVSIRVIPADIPPKLVFDTNQLAGSVVYKGYDLELRGFAYDWDGDIDRIELYDGTNKISQVKLDESWDDGRFYLPWKVDRADTIHLTVVAVDDRGGSTSAQMTISTDEMRVMLTQDTTFALVGDQKSVFAKVVNQRNEPLPFNPVLFSVSGAHTINDQWAFAGSGAEAKLTYTGNTAGTDVVTAVAMVQDDFSDPHSVTNTWLPASTNQPPSVSAGGPYPDVYLSHSLTLNGSATDDGYPNQTLTYTWRMLSSLYYGSGLAVFADSHSPTTTVTFTKTGDYQLELTASDSMFSARSVVNVRVVDNLPPVLTWSVSTNEGPIGTTYTISAQATDEDDNQVYSEFYDDGNWIAWWSWSKANPSQTFTKVHSIARRGISILTARAQDSRGLQSQPSPIYIFGGVRPTVAWLTPTNTETVAMGGPLELSVAATDSDGVVTNVTYYLQSGTDETLLGYGEGAQFSWVWTPTNTGAFVLSAKAWDNDGLFSADKTVQVQVVAALPEIAIVAPASGDIVHRSTPSIVALEVADPNNIITNFEAEIDGALVARGTNSSFVWIPSQTGSHTIRAFADDSFGRRVLASPVTVTALDLVAPVAMFVTPTNQMRYAAGAAVSVYVEASDSDGMVNSIALLLDGALTKDTTNAVLDCTLTNLAGWRSLRAYASDNTELTGGSDEIRIFVERSEDNALPVPQGLVAQALSESEIRLSWNAITSTPPLAVIVERWETNLSAWIEIDGAVAVNNTFTDSDLNTATLYRYRVAATDETGRRSVYSAEVKAVTRTDIPVYSAVNLNDRVMNGLLGQQVISNRFTDAEFNDFDARLTQTLGNNYAALMLGTNASVITIAAGKFKQQWPEIQLDFDPLLVTPGSILPRSGFLTGTNGSGVTVSDATAQLFSPDDPYRPVKAFVQEYRDMFGHGAEALDAAMVRRDFVSDISGARSIVWQQQVAGVPVFGAVLAGHITQAGELAALSSGFIPHPELAAKASLLVLVQNDSPLPVAPDYSLVAAMANVGEVRDSATVLIKSQPEGAIRKQTFAVTTGASGDVYVELTWFPERRDKLRLCWQVLFTGSYRDEMYLTLVDVETSEVLLRRSLTTTSSDASYRVYTGNSPSPMMPGWPSPNIGQPPLVDRSLLTLTAGDLTASPNGWINDGDNETRGNNVDASLDRNDDDLPDSRPVGHPFRVFDFPLDLNSAPQSYGDAATVQLFYWNNWMHDALYRFGFTEATGNFQGTNFNRGGLGGDPVIAQAQDGANVNDGRHVNNANMSTPPDGYAPRMQMYVFDGASPDRDGSLDADIILHEYAHGLSCRLVGGGVGISALATAGMGEGWSDFYALSLLSDAAGDVDGAYPVGSYSTHHGFGSTFEENYYYGIRRYPYSTDMAKNPLTFADIDPILARAHSDVPRSPLTGPFRPERASSVHHAGEVWCQMLWEIRARLIYKYGFTLGNSLALQLVTDGMRLSPPDPNFVQGRDAILLADRILTDGANESEIWAGFSKRGLGFNAKAPHSRTTTGVRESFDVRPVLGTDRVEVQDGNANGIVEGGEGITVVVYLRNQGQGDAANVSAQLTTTTPGVTIAQGASGYPQIPQGQSRPGIVAFQVNIATNFGAGAPIDLTLAITADQFAGSNFLRVFTGVSNPDILFDNFSALPDALPISSLPRDFTPVDILNLEPLWMAENGSCLLKGGEGKYVLWETSDVETPMIHPGFLAHRLTRNGILVGQIRKTNIVDRFGNQIHQARGVKWVPGAESPVNLTLTSYQFPKNAAVANKIGSVYSLLTGNLEGLITDLPQLGDIWDLNAQGDAAGTTTVYVRPQDIDNDGSLSDFEIELGLGQRIRYRDDGKMNWEEATERSYQSRSGVSGKYEAHYNALISTAAIFPQSSVWRWLGPLSFVPEGNVSGIATLINDAGMVGGYGAVVTGNTNIDKGVPTHAFRWLPAFGEFAEGASVLSLSATPRLQDLGVLSNGLYSQPYSMNQAGEMVGYSDFGAITVNGVNPDPYYTHGVYWGPTDTAPVDLPTFGPVGPAEHGYGFAYSINDRSHIVGTSYRPPVPGWTAISAGVMWKRALTESGDTEWQMTDLNDRLNSEERFVKNAVAINNDGLILAEGLKVYKFVSPDPQALMLVPISVKSRDRFFKGTIDIPAGTSPGDVSVGFYLAEPFQEIAIVQGQERVYESREVALGQIADKISKFIGGTGQRFTDKVVLYRDPKDPNKLYYAGYSPKLGEMRIHVRIQNRDWPTIEHTLEPDAEFAEFASDVDRLSIGNLASGPLNDGMPTLIPKPSPSSFVGINRFTGYTRGQPYENGDQTMELYMEALTALMTESLIDQVAIPIAAVRGAISGLRDGIVFDAEAVYEVLKLGVKMNPIVMPFYMPQMVEDLVHRVKSLTPLIDYMATLQPSDIPVIAKNVGRVMYTQWTTKAQSDLGWIYEGNPVTSNPEVMIAYTEGYAVGFIGEQVAIAFLTAGGSKAVAAGRLPEMVGHMIKVLEIARGGLAGVAMEGVKTARAGMLATYLTYAAKAPDESWLRRLAQSPFKIENYLKGSRFGNETLDKLFEKLSQKGVYEADRVIAGMVQTRNFKPLQAAPEALEVFQARYAEVLSKLEAQLPPGSWTGTEGLVRTLDNLFPPGQADRVPDLLKALGVEDSAAARQWAAETLANASSKTSDEILAQGLKVSEKVAQVHPTMYHYADGNTLLSHADDRVDGLDGVWMLKRDDRQFARFVTPEDLATSKAARERLQLPLLKQANGAYTIDPNKGRFKCIFQTVDVADDLVVPPSNLHSRSLPAGDNGARPWIQPITFDNPQCGPGGAVQFMQRKEVRVTVIDLETGETVRDKARLLEILNQ